MELNKNLKDLTISLTLAGGAARGAYEIGVFNALHELDLLDNIKVVSGTSIGAINSLFFALKDKELTNIIWNSLSYSRFLNYNNTNTDTQVTSDNTESIRFPRLKNVITNLSNGNMGLASQKPLEDFLNEYIDFDKVINSPIDIYACSYNLNKYEPEYFRLQDYGKEDIIKIILASSCVPIIFKAIEFNGEKYADGGCYIPSYPKNNIDNTPILPTTKYNCDISIVVELAPKDIISDIDYPNENIIHIFPSSNIEAIYGTGPINLNPKTLASNIELGYRDTLVALAPTIVKILKDRNEE